MAEGSVSLPVTPEITKPDGGSSRRNSMGKTSSSSTGEKILPHYLRASTGSCHDFCKYGRKHAFEEKARRPFPKRALKKPPEDQNPVVRKVLPQKKETLVVKAKPSRNSKTLEPDTCDIIKQVVSTKLVENRNLGESVVLVVKENKSSPVEPKPSRDSQTCSSNTPRTTKQERLLSSAEKEVPLEQLSSKSKKLISSRERANSLKPISKKTSLASAPNPSGSLSGKRNIELKIGKRTGVPKVTVKKVLASPKASLSPKHSLTRVVSLNARTHRTLRVVPPPRNPDTVKNVEPEQPKIELKHTDIDMVQEKTLYVIKTESENIPVESDQTDSCFVELSQPPLSSPLSLPQSQSSSSRKEEDEDKSEYTVTETDDDSLSEYGESVDTEEMETSEGESKLRLGNSGIVCSNEEDGQAVNLHFRRGKVVSVQSENDGPRRLKFRQGRVLGENKNVKTATRRRFKSESVDGEADDSKNDSEKVVLRHQDVQGKKDAQGLFNNVIEETASKLAETRKSKVKALVGAFETVISLQESKPSANTVS